MADPSSPMSMLSEQLAAASRAWIPLLLLVVAIAAGMWGILEWIYRAVLRKRQQLYEMSRSEVEHYKELATRTAEELTEKAKELDEQKEVTQQIKTLSGRLTRELNQLGQANTGGILGPALRGPLPLRGPLRYPPPTEG